MPKYRIRTVGYFLIINLFLSVWFLTEMRSSKVYKLLDMSVPRDERRQIENEMIFRRANEKVGIALAKIDAMYTAEGHPQLAAHDDFLLEFRCECSDENCSERIRIKLSKYQKIHLNRESFIIKPNHQVNSIEKVFLTNPQYSVVKKYNLVSEPGNELNKTEVSNV